MYPQNLSKPQDNETFSSWLSKYCEIGPCFKEQAQPLLESYLEFLNGQYTDGFINHMSFAREMAEHGWEKKRASAGIFYKGIRLRSEIPSVEDSLIRFRPHQKVHQMRSLSPSPTMRM